MPSTGSATDGAPLGLRRELSVVVPMYREALRIAPTIRDLIATLPELAPTWEVILVDDGSPDDTVQVATQTLRELDPAGTLPVRIFRHAANQGKGGAVRTGLRASNAKACLVMDADNACRVKEASVLLETLNRSQSPAQGLVAGSRRARGAEVTAIAQRQLAGWLFRAVLRTLGLAIISDTQCGFKLYRADLASHIARLSRLDGYAYDLEHLLLARRSGLGITEVGVRWEHQSGGQVRPVRDGLRMAWAALLLRLKWTFRPPAMPRLDTAPAPLPSTITEAKPLATISPAITEMPAAS